MTNKKNICLFTSVDWFILSHREDLFLKFSEISKKIYVVVFEDTGVLSKKYPNIVVVSLKSNRSNTSIIAFIKSLITVIKTLKKLEIDTVWTVSMKPCFVMLLAERFIQSEVIYTISGLGTLYSSSRYKFYIARFIFENLVKHSTSKIIVQNYEDKALFQSIRNSGIYLVLGSGIELTEYRRMSPNTRVEKVVFIGRTLISKGIKDFLWIAQQLRDTDIQFEIYGDSDDNIDSINIRDVELKKLNPNLFYYGKIDYVQDVLSKASVIILPSLREGLSLTLCEAAASGLALLTYDVAGCREVCIHGTNGYTSRVNDKRDLVNNLKLLMDDPGQLLRFSKASMELAEKFDKSSINSQLLSILNA